MPEQLEAPSSVLYLDEAAPRALARAGLDGADGGHGGRRPGVHPLHVGHDQGSEGRRRTRTAYTCAKRMQAEHWLGRPAGRPSSGARPGPAGRSRSGTFCSAPGALGRRVVLHEGGFDPEERFELLARLGVTVLCQAPTEYRLMAKRDPGSTRTTCRRIRHAVSAGEPLNPEVIARFRDAFGVTIYDGYGQTENTLLVGEPPRHADPPGLDGPAVAGTRDRRDRRARRQRCRPARRATSRCAGARRRSSAATGRRPRRRPRCSATSGT